MRKQQVAMSAAEEASIWALLRSSLELSKQLAEDISQCKAELRATSSLAPYTQKFFWGGAVRTAELQPEAYGEVSAVELSPEVNMATSEGQAEEAAPLPCTAKEAALLPSPAEEAVPLPCTAEEAVPLPCTAEEAVPLPCTAEEAVPLPCTAEEAVPLPCTAEEAVPLPSTAEEAVPLPRPARGGRPALQCRRGWHPEFQSCRGWRPASQGRCPASQCRQGRCSGFQPWWGCCSAPLLPDGGCFAFCRSERQFAQGPGTPVGGGFLVLRGEHPLEGGSVTPRPAEGNAVHLLTGHVTLLFSFTSRLDTECDLHSALDTLQIANEVYFPSMYPAGYKQSPLSCRISDLSCTKVLQEECVLNRPALQNSWRISFLHIIFSFIEILQVFLQENELKIQ
ncbi:skin secretory protein xP2 [Ictalurus punctatus]|uniref:Skin secretory protein xP2 n=1 Tax=Ictalurus punctatus TaxID=7998 RepID=A0A9F7R688_ICTPU|nr:skin secretory protein xP2 [Ictalurus punctatus]